MYPLTLDLVRAESAWITPPSERLVACHWCGDHAGDRAKMLDPVVRKAACIAIANVLLG